MIAIITRIEKYFAFQQPLVWRNVIGIFIMNLATLYTIFCIIPFHDKPFTIIFGCIYGYAGGLGVTIGAHRLWTHKTFKAKLPLRIFIMFWYLSAGMYSLVQWVRDHRTHHKFTDTDADPHNAKRGFVFSHCGWLMMKRHPELIEKGKLIDVSDLLEDPVVRFEEKYFVPLLILCHIVIPLAIGRYVFHEPSWFALIVGLQLTRYTIMLHMIWCVNSVAHLWGTKPYNKNIKAVDNKMTSLLTLGEAYHNFHHTFPWDHRIGEPGQRFLIGTYFIGLFAKFGWAYDLKTASPEMIQRVLDKNGNLQINEEVPYPEIEDQQVKEEIKKEKAKVN